MRTKFPYDIFPNEIVKLLEDAEVSLNYPIEYLASCILVASSAAIGNTYHVKLKEGFIIKSNIFMAIVGRPGDVKTHPLNFAFNPIEKTETVLYDQYIKSLKNYNQEDYETKKTIEKPVYKKTLLKDFTPESLIKIHSHNSRGITIVADELNGWIKNFGRYNNSGEQETYLSLWSGNSISVDRKGDEPLRIDNTHVNVIGTIQNKLLKELSKDNRSENGFMQRMIFVLNENPKPVLWNDSEIDKKNISNYEILIQQLQSLKFNEKKSNIINLSNEAKKRLIEWQRSKKQEYFNDDIAYAIQAKYEVYTLRFALILQLTHWALHGRSKDIIDLFIIECSIKLVEYYFENALKVNNIIYNYNPIDNLTELQKSIYNELNNQFTTKDAIEISNKLGMNERTLKRFLKNSIFKRVKQGLYNKID